jgi:acetyl-CoA synthetase
MGMLIDPASLSYDTVVSGFSWQIPPRMNIADLVCDRHDPDRVAVIEDRGDTVSYGALRAVSQRIAGGLAARGVGRGDRVAVTLPPSAVTLATHLAALRLGAVSVPISGVYEGDGLAHRLSDSGARIYVTDEAGMTRLARINRPATLTHAGGVEPGDAITTICATGPDDPAFVFYTSATTGTGKGAVLAHRFLLGHLPGFQLVFNLAPQPGDVFFTPSDWSWIASLGEVVLPVGYFGFPLVAVAERFSVSNTYRVLSEHGVTCPFLAPAVLRRMRADPPAAGTAFRLRAIMTGGEAVSDELRRFVADRFDAALNDIFGQTEANHLACGCEALFATPAGAIGRVLPGRRVTIRDSEDRVVTPGAPGEICLAADDPIVMLGYFNQPALTAAKIRDGWVRLGDRGRLDADGCLFFAGRLDDLIKVQGVQVGCEEVEAVVISHEAVAEAGVCGVPVDDDATAVCVFVRLRAPGAADFAAEEVRRLVRERVGRHATPRFVHVVESLPTTATGKIERRTLARWHQQLVADAG